MMHSDNMAALNDVLDCCTVNTAVIQDNCKVAFLWSELMVISDFINEKDVYY